MIGTICPHCGGLHDAEPGLCHRPPLDGRILPDGIRVLKPLGPVDIGALFSAEDASSHIQLNLLLLHPGLTPQFRPLFSRAVAIRHPNVAGVRTVGQTPEGVCYVVFEVFEGQLLSELLQARPVLSPVEAADLVLQAAAGIQEIHRVGLLHGDLSPETILITRTANDRPLVKLVRLGSMRHETRRSTEGDAAAKYAAPERLVGHPVDQRSDVFSLGAVLHHLLTGAPPSDSDSAEPVPDAAWPVLSKALDPVPERRYPTAAAFATALAGVVGRAETGSSTGGRARGARAAGVVAAGLIATVTGLWLTRNAQHSRGDAEPVEAATARDTGAVPEGWENGRPPSAALRDAPAPPPRQSPRQPASEPSGRSPTKPSPASLESMAPKPRALAVLGPAPPESLELQVGPREPLRIKRPSVSVAHLLDSAVKEPRTRRPAAVPANSEAEARAAVQQVVTTYARALESNDLRAMEWTYPEMTEREREAWKKFFSVARDLDVTLHIERYAIAGSEAKVDVRGTYQYWNRSLNRSDQAPVRFLATLKRSASGWRLTAIR